MNRSSIVRLVLIGVIAGGGWYVHARKTRSEAFVVAETAVRRLLAEKSSLTARVETNRRRLDSLKAAKKGAAGTDGSGKDTPEQIEKLKRDVHQASQEWHRATAEFEALQDMVQTKAKQKTFPEIPLRTGEVLKHARFTEFGEDFATIKHDAGTKQARPEDFSEEWVKRLSLDYVAGANKLSELALQADEVLSAGARSIGDDVDQTLPGADIETVDKRLLELSHQIRDAQAKALALLRQAYKEAATEGPGDGKTLKNRQAFDKAKVAADASERIRAEYRALRRQKQELVRRQHEALKLKQKPE